jgi:hypothetical protein
MKSSRTPKRPGNSTGARINEEQAAKQSEKASTQKLLESITQGSEQILTESTLATPKPNYPSGRKSPQPLQLRASPITSTEERVDITAESPRIASPDEHRKKNAH